MIGTQMPVALQAMLALGGIEVLAGLCVLFARRPMSAVALILASLAAQIFMLQPPSISVGATIYLPDVIFLAMMIVAILRMRLESGMHGLQVVMFALGSIFIINVFRGIGLVGLQPAINEARPYFYFLSGMIFISSIKLNEKLLDQALRHWLRFSLFFVVAATFFWVAMLASLPIQAVWSREAVGWGNSPFRVLSVQQAMYLSSAMFVSLGFRLSNLGKPWQRSAFIWLLLAVMLLTHRTIWIVSLVGILFLLVSSSRMRTKYGLKVPIIATLVAVALITFGSGNILVSVEKLATNLTTFTWRIESSQALLSDFRVRDITDRLIGQPFGLGYERVVEGSTVEIQPHNFYIQTLISMGFIGLLLLLFLYIKAILSAISLNRAEGTDVNPVMDSKILMVLIIGQLLFFVTYGVTVEMGIMLGLVLGVPKLIDLKSVSLRGRGPSPAAQEPVQEVVHRSLGGAAPIPRATNNAVKLKL